MKSEIELKLEKASKMLSMGQLDPKNQKFVRSLKNKKDIGKITKRQYIWLTNIIQQYKEVSIFSKIRS